MCLQVVFDLVLDLIFPMCLQLFSTQNALDLEATSSKAQLTSPTRKISEIKFHTGIKVYSAEAHKFSLKKSLHILGSHLHDNNLPSRLTQTWT